MSWVRKSRILPILALIVVVLCVICSLFGLVIGEQEKIMPEHLPTPANTSIVIPTMTLTSAPTETLTKVPMAQPTIVPQVCCVMCSKGKACGDSCIAKDFACEVGQGCACDR